MSEDDRNDWRRPSVGAPTHSLNWKFGSPSWRAAEQRPLNTNTHQIFSAVAQSRDFFPPLIYFETCIPTFHNKTSIVGAAVSSYRTTLPTANTRWRLFTKKNGTLFGRAATHGKGTDQTARKKKERSA